MPKEIKFNKDITYYPDGIIAKKGKKGKTYDIPDNLVKTIEAINGKQKTPAPENKAKG